MRQEPKHLTKKEKRINKMEKVIRVCEITGRMTTIADNLTTEQAMTMVKDLAKEDEFGMYRRVIKG